MGTLQHFAVICKECGGRQVVIGIGETFFRFSCPQCYTNEEHSYKTPSQRQTDDGLTQAREMWQKMNEEGYGNVPYEPKVITSPEPPPPPQPSRTTVLMKELIEQHDLEKLEIVKKELSPFEYQYVKTEIGKIIKSLQKRTVHK